MLDNQPRKSRFITILSTISIMVAFYSITQSITTLSMQNSPEFQMAKQFLPSTFISPTSIYFEIFLNVAAIIASIGLFMRLNWGRMMFMVVLAIVTIWEIYSSISSYLALNSFLKQYGIGSSLTIIVFWAIFGIAINIYLIWKLSSEDVRREFGQSHIYDEPIS
jgi:hypothetical protein